MAASASATADICTAVHQHGHTIITKLYILNIIYTIYNLYILPHKTLYFRNILLITERFSFRVLIIFFIVIMTCKYPSLILDPHNSVLEAGDLVVQLHHAQEPAVDHQPPVNIV